MQITTIRAMTCGALTCLLSLGAWAQLPQRDLTIEVRQIEGTQDGAASSGYTVGTAPSQPTFAPQQLRVRNGEKASLRINQAQPMQWAQKIESSSTALSAGGATASSTAGGITQSVVWMEAGHTFTITPRWPGGKKPATVVVDVQTTTVDERTGSELPATGRQQLSSTLTAPLRQWVTIATTGTATPAGTYSSRAGAEPLRQVQIRVLVH